MLVDDEGGRRGEVATEDARRMADERGLDLVEVAPQSNPPVCRLMDYGKFKYEQKKKSQGAKKKAHTSHIKEVRLRPLTDHHDVDIKIAHARGWLTHGDKVLITMTFRGREMAHQEIGREVMEKIMVKFEDIAKVESPMRRDGNRLNMTLVAKPGIVERAEKERDKANKERAARGEAPLPEPPEPEPEPEEPDDDDDEGAEAQGGSPAAEPTPPPPQ